MADHWIPAAKARELAGGFLALCARLHAGLVQSRAELFIVDQDKYNDALLPRGFWWAEGHVALEQDWAKGDFSTWIDHKRHLRAFGVSIALSGVLEMLPPEQRALTARSLSVASSQDWMTANAAYELVCNAGHSTDTATQAILDQARLGFLSARAVEAEDVGAEAKWARREWDIPTWFWSWLPENGSISWAQGTVASQGQAPTGFRSIRLRGMYFLKNAFVAAFPHVAPPVEAEVAAERAAGGRPTAAFTDDLWAATAASLHAGDVDIKTQAGVERWLLDWAATNNHQLSESSARTKARKLVAAIRLKDKKG